MGLWSLKQLQDQAKQEGNAELKKKFQVAIDIVEKYQESSLEVLGQEKKYNFINKFGPKKFPDQQVKRESIRHLYSWAHYAPQQWYEFTRRREQELKIIKEGKETGVRCSSCHAQEGTTLKHKVCSACKKVYYCSTDCQRTHWNNGHK